MKSWYLLLAALLIVPGSALAQSEARDPGSRGGPFSVQAGLGFTADPDSFLLDFEGDYRIGSGFSTGAMLQLGLDEDFTIVSPAAYLRYTLGLGLKPPMDGLSAFFQGGVGFTYIDIDAPRGFSGDDDDIGLLLNFGGGLEYALTDELAVVSKMLVNVLPADVFGENFYYSWEIVGFRYRF